MSLAEETVSQDSEGSSAKTHSIGPGIVLLWYLLTLFILQLSVTVHTQLLGAENFRRYWPYDSAVALGVVVCAISFYRPGIIRLSRWKFQWSDLVIGITVGVLMAWVKLMLTSPEVFKAPLPHSALIPIVFLGPVLEEILFRSIFLRSLLFRFKPLTAMLLVTVIAAVPHGSFWMALVPQLMFCVLYVRSGYSLFPPIACHIVSNTILYFPILRQFFTTTL